MSINLAQKLLRQNYYHLILVIAAWLLLHPVVDGVVADLDKGTMEGLFTSTIAK